MARSGPATPAPAMPRAGFFTVSRTEDELSVVGLEAEIKGETVDTGWTVFKVHGPFAFDQIGIVAGLSQPLADAQVGIFVISTFETDYILVKDPDAAAAAWRAAGHQVDDGADG